MHPKTTMMNDILTLNQTSAMDNLQQSTLNFFLVGAAEDGSVNGCLHVKSLLAMNADPNARSPRTKLSACDTALKHGHLNVLALLEDKANVTTSTPNL